MSDSKLDRTFKSVGTGYELEFPSLGTIFIVDSLRRHSGELHGTLTVRSRWPSARTYNGVMHTSRFNLTAPTTRKSVAKLLSERAPTTPDEELDWQGFLEEFCLLVVEAERVGQPFSLVGMEAEPPQDPFLISPLLLAKDVTILYGDGGVGKSMLAVAMAASVKTGATIIPGIVPNETGDVLYLDWETDRQTQNRRLKSVCYGAQIQPVDMWYRQEALPLVEHIDEILTHLDQHPTKLVVIDSVGLAAGASSEGDAADSVLRFFGVLNHIRNRGCTVLCVDHIAYSQLQGAPSKPYGSMYKKYLARATWELRQAKPTGDGLTHVGLFHQKHNNTARFDPIGLTMLFGPAGTQWVEDVIAGEGLTEGLTQADQIAMVIADHPMTVGEIAAVTGINSTQVRVILNRGRDKRFLDLGAIGWGPVTARNTQA